MILWLLVGGFFLKASDALVSQVSEVSLISGEEFAALILPDVAPEMPVQALSIQNPAPEDDAPGVTTVIDAAPDSPQPRDVASPTPEKAPSEPQPEPGPVAELTDNAPELLAPPIDLSPVLDPARPDDTPKPAPAPRIAPVSAPEPAPDREIADQVTPDVAPDEAVETTVEIQPPSAPQQAASEIVTEAETPASAAPTASVRPTARPSRPAKPEPVPSDDPTAAAIAADVSQAGRSAPVAPTGPPLSRGEKDSLRFAVRQCWVVDVGSIAANIAVTVEFSLDQSGKVVPESVRMIGSQGGEGRPLETAFAAARRAILRCQAGGYNLPVEKYSHWQNIEITFNPENMRVK